MADLLSYEDAYRIGQQNSTTSTHVQAIVEAGVHSLLRPEVLKFALLMEANLRKHDGDRGVKGWEGDPPDQLLNRLDDETQELQDALGRWYGKREFKADVAKEAADVANFAMMIADVVGGLDG